MNVVSYLLVILGYGKPPKYQDLDKDTPLTYEEAMKLIKPVAVVRSFVVEPRGRGSGRILVKREYFSFGRGRAQFREKEEKNINYTYNKKEFSYEF